ncbi:MULTISPECIES: ABC transporter permease [unclassified Streptomyces]|uniref:ABC transporter permease n=1 Tax=unclassified Streptomyces TaxID=2593676 RepID=UPI001BECC8A2|nr:MULTISPECIES: ABC transporter permease [unclassified Streptomyces]MBT2406599.1 ABC transporter permease [Streptomyces sp. ISL-21]MBT2608937.1 ABC transporter permease [Streptomyces sp. ISL-87]
MSTLAHPRAAESAKPAGPRRLHGLAWLMVRQHRAMLLTCVAVTVLGAAWIVYERSSMLDTLHAAGWPAKPADAIDNNVHNAMSNRFNEFAGYLEDLPLLLGVFLGAPLVSSDHEQGTARLVTTQSVPRGRWLLWKLGFAFLLVTVTTGVLSVLFAWWRGSVGPFTPTDWLHGAAFDSTVPVLIAMSLLTTSLGIAVGALTRRVVAAMVLTFLGSAAVLVAAELLKDTLATPRRLTYPLTSEQPATLDHVVQVDQWVGTASGKLYGWGTCVNDQATEVCRARLGIVNNVWEYFGHDQLAGMQWTAVGLYLTLTALFVAVFLWRTRRGPI